MRNATVKLAANAILAVAIALCVRSAVAQGNYEIQVYGADTVAPKTLMTELHSNFTPEGQKDYIDGVIPTNHQEHETLELTEGITSWSEIGFYVFTSEQDVTVCSGSAITYARASAHPIAGIFRWVSVYRPKSATSEPSTRRTHGPGRYGPSLIRPWVVGISHSIRH